MANEKTKEQIELENQLLRISQMTLEAQEKQIEKLNERYQLGKITKAQLDEQLTKLEKYNKLTNEQIDALINENKIRKIKVGLQEQEQQAFEKYNAEFKSYTGRVTEALGLSQQLSSTLTGGWVSGGFALVGFIKKIKNLNNSVDSTEEKLKMASSAAMGLSNAGDGIAGAFLGRLENMILATDRMRSEFFKTTQASDEMGDVVLGTSEKLQRLSLDFELAGQAVAALREGSTTFKHAQPDVQKELGKTVGVLMQAGVSAQTSTQALDVLTKVMGRDVPTATKSLSKFGSIAESLDMSMEQFSKEFVEASKKLAYNGPKMEKVFIGLQSQAYATGVSMSELLDITGQFDTFEGAAKAVSQLNGILGGPYLNSIEMVYMSEEQRIKTMRDSIRQSGKAWGSMSKFERMAVMTAAGVKDLESATRLFGTSTEEYEKAEARARAAAEQQKNFEEAAQKATDITKKFENAMNNLIITFGPALNMVVDLVEGFAKWAKELSEGERKFVFFATVFGGVAIKVISWWVAMKMQANAYALAQARAMGVGGGPAAGAAAAAAGRTSMLAGAWNKLVRVFKVAGRWLVGLLPAAIKLVASAIAGVAGTLSLPFVAATIAITATITAIYYWRDEIKAAFKSLMDWFGNTFTLDNMKKTFEDALGYVRGLFGSSLPKYGPLADLDKAGENIPDMLSKGVEKGIEFKVNPRMEKLAVKQGQAAMTSAASAATTKTFTPSRTQTQSQQPVQLVIDYKGVKRLLGEISTDLLEDAIGLRLA